uniref:Uncharacterized protein n=1 Tax=Archaeoglobus fulgidus TaxID=2234 RepID=A0A7J3M1U0_ARCFL
MDEKAVSETTGYIMILGIVMFLISIVYVQVYNTTIDTAEKFRVISIRESFRKIYDVFALSLYGGTSLQQIQLELQGGSFYITKNATIGLRIFDDNGTLIDSCVINLNSLNYELENFRISFENGGLIEDNYGYSKFMLEPSIYLRPVQSLEASGEKEKVLVLVLNEIESELSVSGSGSIVIVFNSSLNLSKMYPMTGRVILNIKSDYPELWKDYFEKKLGATVSSLDTNEIFIEITFNKLVVTVYKTNITLKKF